MLDDVQTAGIIAAALVSAYAVWAAELTRKRDARRARVERVLEAVLRLTEAAVRVQDRPEEAREGYDLARRRLTAELKLVGVEGFEHTDLMVRDTPSIGPREVVSQSDLAIREIGARLDELAPRPPWKRQPRLSPR